jgi:hypothetical protein
MTEQSPIHGHVSGDGTRASSSHGLFEPGRLMPEQYDDLVRRRHVIDGEKRLMLAVLEDAIRTYLRNADAKDGERRREFLEAKSWFNSEKLGKRGSQNVFSFENLCETLGIEPVSLRQRLRAMSLDDLPARRYQNRRHRPLSSLRFANDRAGRQAARSLGT